MLKKRVKPTSDGPVPHWTVPIFEHLGRHPLSAQFVAKWLNNAGLDVPAGEFLIDPTGKTDGYYRITNLIKAFQDAAQDLSTPGRARLYSSPDPVRRPKELPAPLLRINQILDHYLLMPFCPSIDADLRRWHVRWVPTRRGRSPHSPASGPVTPEETGWLHAGEIEVLQQVLTMASEGTLDYLAVCRCGRWYVRRRLDQTFCRAECRTEFRRSSETWKAHRRTYMRRYYRLKVSGKVK